MGNKNAQILLIFAKSSEDFIKANRYNYIAEEDGIEMTSIKGNLRMAINKMLTFETYKCLV